MLQLKYSQFIGTEILEIQEKKTKKLRRIKINEDLRAMVERIKLNMTIENQQQYIFINKYGTKPIDKSYVNVKLKEIVKKYNVPMDSNISSHLFRKTLGNRILRLNNYSSESVILLQEVFSHSSPALTKRYLGLREKQILDVYDSLKL